MTGPELIDVTRPIAAGMAIYPRNPAVSVTLVRAIARGDSSNVSLLSLGSHTGTHVDAPRHMRDGTASVDELALSALVGPALVVAIPADATRIGPEHLEGVDLGRHRRILFRSRNSERYAAHGTFEDDFTFLAPEAAAILAGAGVLLVGIDALSVEQYHAGHHRTHDTLLSRGIVIIEGLALEHVEPGEYELICLPLPLAGCDGAPARVVLRRGAVEVRR